MRKDESSKARGKLVSRETSLPGRAWLRGLALATALPLLALFLLYFFKVPLGKPGKFLHLYSQLTLRRVLSVPPIVLLLFVQVCGVWLLAACERRPLRGGAILAWAMLLASTIGFGTWAWYAPPDHLSQHSFNLVSPSHDGAFSMEGLKTKDLRAYLRDFPRYVVSPEARWGGTRIMSNPPGLTMLAFAIRDLHRAAPGFTNALLPTDELPDDPGAREALSVGLLFGIVLHQLWVLAVVPWYLVGRLWLSRAESAAIAICCVFTPATLMLTPGKDPAQLFSVGLLAWLWMLGVSRRSALAAGLLGPATIAALLLSLVHIWVAAVLIAAASFSAGGSGFADGNGPPRRVVTTSAIAWSLGLSLLTAAIASVALAWLCGYETWRALPAIAKGQATVTRGPDAMPFWWQALGIPLYMVFCGPAVWALGIAAFRRRGERGNGGSERAASSDADPARLGRALIVASLIVMIATVGFTNIETPRLWMPFAALVVLGGALVVFRGGGASTPVSLAALLVAAQVAGSVGQWTLMDMREAESRLRVERPTFFGKGD